LILVCLLLPLCVLLLWPFPLWLPGVSLWYGLVLVLESLTSREQVCLLVAGS
jgi:hypothetical protein